MALLGGMREPSNKKNSYIHLFFDPVDRTSFLLRGVETLVTGQQGCAWGPWGTDNFLSSLP